MVDIHAHILPGLDDGAESLEEAVQMAEMAAASGIGHMAASSHGNYYHYTLEEYRNAFELLTDALSERQIPLRLYPAMEIFTDEEALPLLKQGGLLTLNRTNYVLLEFDFDENPENVCRRIGEIQNGGYRVVLAHPERYFFVQRDPELAFFLAEQGVVLQLNQNSVLGDFGKNCRRLACMMLEEGIVGLIATDAHDTRYRTPSVSRLVRFLREAYSTAEVRLWLSENPSRILKGQDIL